MYLTLSLGGVEGPLSGNDEKKHHSNHVDALSEVLIAITLVIKATTPSKNGLSLGGLEPIKCS